MIKAGQPDRSDDRRLGSERAERQADEQNRADAKREPAEVDLTDQITNADGEK